MTILNKSDYFSVRLASTISEVDKTVLIDLYQPLISAQGVALYLTLVSLESQRDFSPMVTHEQLFGLTQLEMPSFQIVKGFLEGIGLIKSYKKKLSEGYEYLYEIYAPKSAKDFFEDPILSGLLKKYIGSTAFIKIQSRYKADEKSSDYEEISRSFSEVFHPDLNDPEFFAPPTQGLKGKVTVNVKKSFDSNAFVSHAMTFIENEKDFFTPELLSKIEHYATLTGVDELAMAEIVVQAIKDFPSKTIDFDQVLRRAAQERQLPLIKQRRKPNLIANPKSDLGQKVNLMETTSPVDFLRYKQNNTQPASADVHLVNDLSLKQGLPFPVVNALVDYVLQKKNNTLPRAYVEKLAASLARETITSAIDAMDFLTKVSHPKDK